MVQGNSNSKNITKKYGNNYKLAEIEIPNSMLANSNLPTKYWNIVIIVVLMKMMKIRKIFYLEQKK